MCKTKPKLAPGAMARITALREATEKARDGEIVRRALRLYESLIPDQSSPTKKGTG
jgi:hypothetical protein